MEHSVPFLLSDESFQAMAEQFKVLSQPLRLGLVSALQSGERTVSQLVAATGSQQGNVSRHLMILVSAGVLGRRRVGANVYYFISDPFVLNLCQIVRSKLNNDYQQKAAAFSRQR